MEKFLTVCAVLILTAGMWSAEPETRKIALTFDDGPHPVYTEEMLKVLEQEQVPATFFLLGENEKDTEEFYSYVKGKYPQIVILGKGNLEECEKDEFDKIINEINALTPQAVLGCSKNFGIERFVQEHRKKINTRVFFCLGQCEEIRKESGVKKTWLEKLLEKNSFKKMVSQYKEGTEKGEG